jgi:two-component system CheB/CheR fusion protein
VIAPDQELTIENVVLRPRRPSKPRGLRHPVDIFFRSLAQDQGERAIGVVLSGTGTNGVEGLRLIKGEGGIVVAQEPDTAGFEGMPLNQQPRDHHHHQDRIDATLSPSTAATARHTL